MGSETTSRSLMPRHPARNKQPLHTIKLRSSVSFFSKRKMGVSIPVMPTVALVAGVFSHLGFFRIGEHHLYGMRYILSAITIFIVSIFSQGQFLESSISTSATRSCSLAACYFAGIYASLVVYRLFFHQLRGFPGPLGCRLSSAWFSNYLGKQDAFRQLGRLHDRYGLFPRIGSNDFVNRSS